MYWSLRFVTASVLEALNHRFAGFEVCTHGHADACHQQLREALRQATHCRCRTPYGQINRQYVSARAFVCLTHRTCVLNLSLVSVPGPSN